jgi:hypothetical protein
MIEMIRQCDGQLLSEVIAVFDQGEYQLLLIVSISMSIDGGSREIGAIGEQIYNKSMVRESTSSAQSILGFDQSSSRSAS